MGWRDTRWKELALEGVAKALCAVFEVEWESDAALALIRKAYQTDSVAPEAERNENVIYISIQQVQDTPTSWASTSYGTDGKATLQKTLPLTAMLTFYGQDCEEMAEYARTRLLADTGYDSPRSILRRYKMVPVLPFLAPIPAYEPDDAMWRLRADLRIRLNLLHEDVYDFEPVEEIPEIRLEKS